jgi:hypothetical protein
VGKPHPRVTNPQLWSYNPSDTKTLGLSLLCIPRDIEDLGAGASSMYRGCTVKAPDP